jgi:hypothetical protein
MRARTKGRMNAARGTKKVRAMNGVASDEMCLSSGFMSPEMHDNLYRAHAARKGERL